MKRILLATLLAACGDNRSLVQWCLCQIHPDAPDAGLYGPAVGLDETNVQLDGGVSPDSGVYSEAECEDTHIDLNGHEHKCHHDQELPGSP